jgi:hypothetical protein
MDETVTQKDEENVSLSLLEEKEERERERRESKSYPLHLKQINLISFLFFLLYIHKAGRKKKKVDSSCRGELPLLVLSIKTIVESISIDYHSVFIYYLINRRCLSNVVYCHYYSYVYNSTNISIRNNRSSFI